MNESVKKVRHKTIQAAAILVILSAWLLIGVAAFAEFTEGRTMSAVLMAGQGMLVTGFGLAILRALQTGFGALDRFFGAILQRTARSGGEEPVSVAIDEEAFGRAVGPAAQGGGSRLPEERPALARATAEASFEAPPSRVAPRLDSLDLDLSRPVEPQRALAAKAPLTQRSLSGKSAAQEPAPRDSAPARAAAAKTPPAKPAPAKAAPPRSVTARPVTTKPTRPSIERPAVDLQASEAFSMDKATARPQAPSRPAAPVQQARVALPARTAAGTAPHPIEEGFMADRAYRILSDGTVEVETLLGVRAFESLDAAREFIGAPRVRPESAANEAYSSAA